jgi:hypothetical protein
MKIKVCFIQHIEHCKFIYKCIHFRDCFSCERLTKKKNFFVYKIERKSAIVCVTPYFQKNKDPKITKMSKCELFFFVASINSILTMPRNGEKILIEISAMNCLTLDTSRHISNYYFFTANFKLFVLFL